MSDGTEIQSGDGSGNRVRVDADGRAATASSEAPWTVYRSLVSVGTSSDTLVAARDGRRGIRILAGANPVYVRFDGGTATNQDWPVAAGAQLVLDHFPCEEEITAIAVGGNSNCLVLEMA